MSKEKDVDISQDTDDPDELRIGPLNIDALGGLYDFEQAAVLPEDKPSEQARHLGQRAITALLLNQQLTTDQRIIDLIDNEVAYIIRSTEETAKLIEQYEQDAAHDHLTGLLNPGQISYRLNQSINSLARLNIRLTADNPEQAQFGFGILFLDQDNFKRINKRHGHQTGNGVLRATAESLQSEIRETDLAFRFGGDEMLVFYNMISLEQIEELVERIESLQAHIKKNISAIVPDSTVSMGLAIFNPEYVIDYAKSDGTISEEEKLAPIIEKADILMRKVKRRGKNAFIMEIS